MTDEIAYLEERINCLENVVDRLFVALHEEASPNMEQALSNIWTKWHATDDEINMRHNKPIEVVI